MKKRLIIIPSCLIGIILISVLIKISCYPTLQQRLMSHQVSTETYEDLIGTKVALYFGHGMDGHSALAIGRALQWMGCHVEVINADGIKRGFINSYDILACPGGESNPDPWGELGLEGKSKIQEFIKSGGGYIGICLGALYACESCDFWGVHLAGKELYLDLFPGVAYCGQEEISPQGVWPLMTWLNVPNEMHPITSSMPKRLKIVYYPSSPYFRVNENAKVAVVATYEISGNPAMVAFEYGKGRVFLSGPHPEIEVDSDRDGSDRFNDLEDEGSEWPLLLAVVRWLTQK